MSTPPLAKRARTGSCPMDSTVPPWYAHAVEIALVGHDAAVGDMDSGGAESDEEDVFGDHVGCFLAPTAASVRKLLELLGELDYNLVVLVLGFFWPHMTAREAATLYSQFSGFKDGKFRLSPQPISAVVAWGAENQVFMMVHNKPQRYSMSGDGMLAKVREDPTRHKMALVAVTTVFDVHSSSAQWAMLSSDARVAESYNNCLALTTDKNTGVVRVGCNGLTVCACKSPTLVLSCAEKPVDGVCAQWHCKGVALRGLSRCTMAIKDPVRITASWNCMPSSVMTNAPMRGQVLPAVWNLLKEHLVLGRQRDPGANYGIINSRWDRVPVQERGFAIVTLQ